MEKITKKTISLTFSEKDLEEINAIFEEKSIAVSSSWTGIQIIRALILIAFENTAPRVEIKTPADVLENIELLSIENENLKSDNFALKSDLESLNNQKENETKTPAGAIVLNFADSDKQKLKDLRDYAIISGEADSYEKLIAIMLATLQEAELFLLTEEDYKLLAENRNEDI